MTSRMNKLKEKLMSYNLYHLRKEVKKMRKNMTTSAASYQQIEEYLELERNENILLLRQFANYQENHENIVQQKQQEYNELKKHHEDMKAQNEETILELREKIKSMENEQNSQKANKSGYSLNESMLEVTSLQSVLEMKQEEIRHMRLKIMTLQIKVDTLPETENLLQKLNARCEDLEAQMKMHRDAKINLEVDNKRLQQLLHLESKERETLLMMNEMLKWKVQGNMNIAQE